MRLRNVFEDFLSIRLRNLLLLVSKWFKIASQCDLLENERFGSFVVFLTFFLDKNLFWRWMEDHCNPTKKFKLNFKQVCGQCRGEFRAQRSCDTTRGKHFDNLENFLKVERSASVMTKNHQKHFEDFLSMRLRNLLLVSKSFKSATQRDLTHNERQTFWQPRKFLESSRHFWNTSWPGKQDVKKPHQADPAHPFAPRIV